MGWWVNTTSPVRMLNSRRLSDLEEAFMGRTPPMTGGIAVRGVEARPGEGGGAGRNVVVSDWAGQGGVDVVDWGVCGKVGSCSQGEKLGEPSSGRTA